MLPFLKDKKEASVSAPPSTITRESDDESDSFDSLEVAAQDLCDAIHSRNYKAVAEALRAAFELCESEPHEEGPHG